MEITEFSCPRCGRTCQSDADRFYGPCTRCRDELRSKLVRESDELVDATYEPKMNVVPNQVATKD